MADETGLTQHIERALAIYHDRGAPLPYLLVATDIKGCTIVVRYTEGDDGLNVEFLISDDGDTMQLPINMMLIDAAGEAAHISIKNETGMTFH
jgi:hypothetical protein